MVILCQKCPKDFRHIIDSIYNKYCISQSIESYTYCKKVVGFNDSSESPVARKLCAKVIRLEGEKNISGHSTRTGCPQRTFFK